MKYLIYSTGVTNVDTIEIDTYTKKNNFLALDFQEEKKTMIMVEIFCNYD